MKRVSGKSANRGAEHGAPAEDEGRHIAEAYGAHVEREQPRSWWHKLLRRRTRYRTTALTVWLYHYAGNADYDGPVLILRQRTFKNAGIRTGALIVLEDDANGVAPGTAPPAAEIRWISTERGRSRMMLCHWWQRRLDRNGTRRQTRRLDRQEELLSVVPPR